MDRLRSIFSKYSWEVMLGTLIVIAVVLSSNLSPYYWNFDQIVYSLSNTIVIPGILGIAFMLVIVLGEIDLSLPAILAVGTVSMAKLSIIGVPVYLALPVVIVIGALLGAFNGWLISKFKLPSLAVTIGTMGAYRALALYVGGHESFAASSFQPPYIWLGTAYLFNRIPVSLLFLLGLFIAFIYIMNRTVFGRLSYAIGNNEAATRFSGHNTHWLKIKIFSIAGAISAFGAYQYVGQYQSARANNASTILLFVVACVVLGGFDINGGKGHVIGLMLSLFLVGTVSNAMGLLNILGPIQTLVIGLIMVLSISMPAIFERVKRLFLRFFSQKTYAMEVGSPGESGKAGGATASAGEQKAARTIAKTADKTDGKYPDNAPAGESESAENYNGDCLLKLDGISKNYGGIQALNQVSFEVMTGEIHGICGENGAGKSTLIKIITGLIQPSSGRVIFNGREASFRTPMEARDSGIVAMYQDPQLFPNLSITENVYMGIQPISAFKTINRRMMYRRTKEIFNSLGVEIDPNSLVAGLTIAEMQFVQFARSYVGGEKLLYILDEPTASLTPDETERLFEFLRELRSEGKSIIIITHRLEELEGLADRISVLRDGEHIITKPKSELSREDIIKHMVGRSLDYLYTADSKKERKEKRRRNREILKVENLRQMGVFDDISFSVNCGEIVGMTGLVGAGRTEIAETIFGITPESSGRVYVNGEEVINRTPGKMVKKGMAYLPEDRDNEGCVVQLSVLKNIDLSIIKRLSRFGIINRNEEKKVSKKFKNRLEIKVSSLESPVKSLSGGNRQKVVLSKWLAVEPDILILDEPTHGIDVAVKEQVHRIINELAEEGIGILVISSDLPEVLSISDRILVVSEGELVAQFDAEEATQEKIMEAATLKKVNREQAESVLH